MGRFLFQMRGASFLSKQGCPTGGIGFDGGFFKKNCWREGGCPLMPPPPTMGNSRGVGGGWHFFYLIFFQGLSFLHLEITLLFAKFLEISHKGFKNQKLIFDIK